jgi:hypothetical protein
LPKKRIVLLTLATIVAIPITVFLIQFLYYNLFVEYFSNIGAMSSELNYYTKSELSDNYDIGFGENSEILLIDNKNLETVFAYKTENTSDFDSDWQSLEFVSENYAIEHCYNGQNMFRHHLNRMVGDRLYVLDEETSTATVVFEVKGYNRILYACDEYCVVYNGNENACQWIDYKNGTIISQQKMDFNLSYWHYYECVYNAYDMVLEFDEFKTYPFITKNQPIMVIDLIEQEDNMKIQ